tara:strand:- start:3154 stop:4707 length:1554 start_codon:yes stop_codon:yes gene_type:complete
MLAACTMLFATRCQTVAFASFAFCACSSGNTVRPQQAELVEQPGAKVVLPEKQAEQPIVAATLVEPWTVLACDGSGVLCVDSSATGKEAGTREEPFHTILGAVENAKSGTTILVAAGSYSEAVQVRDKELFLYGGFVPGSDFSDRDVSANRTVLVAKGNAATLAMFNVGASVVEGFAITGGTGQCSQWYCEGGGLYIDSTGSKTIRIAYNEITGNSVEHEGHNTARGGGVAATGNVLFYRNYIHHNRAERAGGITGQGIRLVENRIEHNTGYGDHGGGVVLFGEGNELIENRIVGNELGRKLGYGWGGGVLIASPGTTFISKGNTITGNFAASGGSGVFIDDGAKGVMTNDLIVANQCGEKGAAGLVVDALDETGKTGSVVDVVNVTIANNLCSSNQGQGNAIWAQGKGTIVRVSNSILWNNGADSLVNLRGEAQVSGHYTLSEHALEGSQNLSVDPGFIDAANGNFELRPTANSTKGSPAIDTGDPKSSYELEPEPNGGRINLGAFGNTAKASPSR